MKKMFVFIIMLGYVFISNSLFSSSKAERTVEYYCGYEPLIQACTWVSEGSPCATEENCKELIVDPEDPTNPIEP